MCCYVPFICANLLRLVYPESTQLSVFYTIAPLVQFANAGMNFFIYILRDKQFSVAFKQIFCCRLTRVNKT